MAREHGGLRLRLAVAAHGAIGDDAAVLERGERRIERVERPAAGLERVERFRIEREARAAVLHQHAGRRQHAAGAELPIERLDVGDDEARWRPPRPSRRCRLRASGAGQGAALRVSILAASASRNAASRNG